MDSKYLVAMTGEREVDDSIASIVRAYEDGLPDLALAYYLTGSWADGTAVGLSDIDLSILFATTPADREIRERGIEIWSSLSSPIHLDVVMRAIDTLPSRPSEIVSLKSASRLMYGTDVRDRLPWPSLAAYLADVTERAYDFVGRVLRGIEDVAPPLDYAAPTEEFYGYDRKRVPWYPAGVERGSKELVTAATRIATAVVALRTGRFVGSKEQSVRLYRETVGDEWADFLELLYEKGKLEWEYQMPTDPVDREMLRNLTERMLGFEEHFLALLFQSRFALRPSAIT